MHVIFYYGIWWLYVIHDSGLWWLHVIYDVDLWWLCFALTWWDSFIHVDLVKDASLTCCDRKRTRLKVYLINELPMRYDLKLFQFILNLMEVMCLVLASCCSRLLISHDWHFYMPNMSFFACCNVPYLLQKPKKDAMRMCQFKCHCGVPILMYYSIFEEFSVKGRSKQFNLGLPRFQFPVLEYRESPSVQTS